MSRRFKAINQQIQDLNGCLLTKEKFQKYLNGPLPNNTPVLPPSNHNNIITGKKMIMWISN